MKKIILMFALIMGVVSASAQKTIQTAKLTDNVSIGINGGVATPLSFNKMFPLNTTVGLRIGKDFTPVFGVNVEGTTWLGSNDKQLWFDGFDNERVRISNRFDAQEYHNTFRGVNVGLNGTVNLTNLFLDYNGVPRNFEVITVTGLGWGHVFVPSALGKDKNNLTAKTAIDFTWNLGSSKATSLYVEPAVLWNLNGNGYGGIQFNKNRAQLALSVGITYHFKTSNGTHYFKEYDIAKYDAKIARLTDELAKKPKELVKEKVVTVDKFYNGEWVVQFAQGSAELTNEAKNVLDKINDGLSVNVVGTASPEGENDFNQRLSEKRAAVVADYLKKRGVRINSWIGKGVEIGESTNRLAIIKVTD